MGELVHRVRRKKEKQGVIPKIVFAPNYVVQSPLTTNSPVYYKLSPQLIFRFDKVLNTHRTS